MRSPYRKSHNKYYSHHVIMMPLLHKDGPLSADAIADWMKIKHQQDPVILHDACISAGRTWQRLPWDTAKLPQLAVEYARQHGLRTNVYNVMRIETGIREYRAPFM